MYSEKYTSILENLSGSYHLQAGVRIQEHAMRLGSLESMRVMGINEARQQLKAHNLQRQIRYKY